MKRIVLLLLIGVSSMLELSAQTKIPFTTGEWPPYISEKLPNGDPTAEIVTAACKEVGITHEYIFYPWARAEKNVVDGDAFGAFPYWFSAEREAKKDVFKHSDPLHYGANVLVFYNKNANTKEAIKFESKADLKRYKVGVIAGSSLIPELNSLGIKNEATTEIGQSLQKMELGRVDYVIDDKAVLASEIARLFPTKKQDFVFIEKSFDEKRPLVLLVSAKYPKSAEILQKFNEGLKKIKSNGVYDIIAKKYGLVK